ncbi:diguanylate cyclase [Deinococcus peraridilitoris]|uniref:Diguanylate cyclase (GGDEF) domain-containing protein n=1 Tax=Deinococcus peraridilitoris (strain DSM 19664 / LMG 22246 / CIP 109416 / KR-200) TaxID=937777 RepID=L0A3X8_DEIPD|nr:diguanylate cyclase [Deinococcus peraridilitoris]AFZ67720.1 diguanylate cyclase (GGDEF) domain-containing protein [Deinococcus peraridilitoris DSM 19664]
MTLAAYILRTLAILWLFVAVIAALLYLGIERQTGHARTTARLQGESKQLKVILKSVVDLETGVRGYLLARQDVFLEPYHAAQARLDAEFATLERLIAAQLPPEAVQARQARVMQARTVLQRWEREVAVPEIRAVREDNFDQAVELVKTQHGRRLVDEFRQIISSLQSDLDAELSAQQQRAAAVTRWVHHLIILSLLALVATSVLIGYWLARQLSRIFGQLTEVTSCFSAGDLQVRAPQASLHEAQTLAMNFNGMADALQASHAQLQQRNEVLQDKNADIRRAHFEGAQLAALSDTLQACYTVQEGYEALQQALPTLFPGWSGALSVIAASRNVTEVKAQWGTGEWRTQETVASPGACWALRRGQAYTLENPMHTACPQQGEDRQGVYVCLPLVAHGEALGTLRLNAQDKEADYPTTAPTRAFATQIARQVALAIANLQLRDTLRHQSVRDPLTGLHNRRYLEESLTRELQRATRQRSPLSLLALDIDHFKAFNDTFGHDGGDAMLSAVAQCMREFFRSEDIVCRFGGEEFVVALLDTPHHEALQRAEGFRRLISAQSVQHKGVSLGCVTVSIGVSAFSADGQDHQALFASADRALYQAKRQGRNQVVSAQAALETPA